MCVKCFSVLVLVLDWTQCLPQGAGAPPAIINIPHSVLTGDVTAHSTLWHSYTDDHRGQLIAELTSNSDHITQTHQPECQTPHYKKHLHQISPRCLTYYTIGHRGQLNMHYHQTIYPSSPQINIRHDYRLQQNRRTFTNYKKADWTQFTEGRVRFRSDHHTYQHTHCQQNFHKHHTDGRQVQHTNGQDA